MVVLNKHSRRFHASPDAVGKLLDTLSSRADALWPHERWPAMRFDGPLGAGASGGHGPIRYSVHEYDPGRRVVFRFHGPVGFDGTHEFQVHALEQGSELRHVVDMRTSGSARLLWPIVFGPLHDALLEDALDKAQASLSGSDWEPRGFSWAVRALRKAVARGRHRRQR